VKYLLIVLLWTGYCTLHSYLISISFTNVMVRLLKDYFAFYRMFYVVISLVLLIPVINYTAQLDSEIIVILWNPPDLEFRKVRETKPLGSD
jgi:methanethiol S-methyltransferase